MSRKYKFHNKEGPYFVSFATVNWIDVFTRQVYFNVLANSVDHCRRTKGMELYCYCFMPSHVHFIFRSSNGKPRCRENPSRGQGSNLLRKRYDPPATARCAVSKASALRNYK